MKIRFFKSLVVSLFMLLSACGKEEQSDICKTEWELWNLAVEKANLADFILESEKEDAQLNICLCENKDKHYCLDSMHAFVDELKNVEYKEMSQDQFKKREDERTIVDACYKGTLYCFLLKESLTAFTIKSFIRNPYSRYNITFDKGYEMSKETGEKLLGFVKDMIEEQEDVE